MISTQYIKLNMIPSGVMPVLYCSQYDVGRPLGMVVYNGSEAVDLDTYSCTIEATRTDGTAITAAVTTSDSVGVFTTTATMTNQPDVYDAQLVLYDNGNSRRVAPLPFVMHITAAAMDENAASIEEDKSLYQQYTESVQTALADINADISAEITARQAAITAEATARQSADNTLQSNINAEASARETADTALQSALTSESAARAAADANLQTQINEIVAPSGEAPSAAEVLNARIGADGVTYPTLGDAIRMQNENMEAVIKDSQKTTTVSSKWTQGAVNSTTGEPTVQSNRIKTSMQNIADYSYVYPASGYKIAVFIYDASSAFLGCWNGVSLVTGTATWFTDSVALARWANGYKFRVVLALTSDEAITPTSSANAIFTLATDADLNTFGVPADAGAVDSKALLYRGTINQAFALSNYKRPGVYRFTASHIPTDAPSDYGINAGVFVNFGPDSSAAISSQLLFENIVLRMWMRMFASDGTPSEWKRFTFTDYPYMRFIGSNDVYDDLDDFTSPGVYSWNSATASIPTHSPENGAGVCLFMGAENATYMAAQMAVMPTGVIYTRYLTLSSGWGAWQTVGVGTISGVNLAMLGDSITAGRVGGQPGGSRPTMTIPQRVAAELGINTTNFGVGGMGWLSKVNHDTNAYEYIQTLDLTGYNYISLAYGANDSAAALGDATDTTEETIMGYVYRTCMYIRNTYPAAEIILITPTLGISSGTFPGWGYTIERGTEDDPWTFADFYEKFAAFGELYHVHVIRGDRCFTSFNVDSLVGDNVHPNEAGYAVAGHYFAGQIGALL